ncbi:MAG: hypothetical protein SH820_07710 [Xanthomonadales bacterium]|nr:hypothetical protein [Xanthomonadales bacterium]
MESTLSLYSDPITSHGSPILAHRSEQNPRSNRQLGVSNTFSLDAYTMDQSAVAARMDCTVNARGKVLRLVRLPDDAPEARLGSL